MLEGRGQEQWEPSQARASSPPGMAKHGPQSDYKLGVLGAHFWGFCLDFP